jgi:hypothetical protein
MQWRSLWARRQQHRWQAGLLVAAEFGILSCWFMKERASSRCVRLAAVACQQLAAIARWMLQCHKRLVRCPRLWPMS